MAAELLKNGWFHRWLSGCQAGRVSGIKIPLGDESDVVKKKVVIFNNSGCTLWYRHYHSLWRDCFQMGRSVPKRGFLGSNLARKSDIT